MRYIGANGEPDEPNGDGLDVPATVDEPARLATDEDRAIPSSAQLVAAAGSLLALVAVGVVGAAVVIVGLSNDASRLSDRQIEYAVAVDEAALNAKGMANDERGFLISGDPEFIRQLDVRTGRVRVALTTAARTASGTEQSTAVSEALVGFESWLHAVNKEIAVFQAGDRKAAVETSLATTRPLRKAYERSLTRADALGQGAVDSATSSVASAARWAVIALIAYLAAALIIGFLVTRWIVGSVVRPMRALQRDLVDKPDELRVIA